MKPIPVGAAALALLATSLSCVGSRGHVHAGQPQVHTRERLITERQVRSEWLRKELASAETKEFKPQGFRDIREFSAAYTQLRGSFDPAAGAVANQELENDALRLEAEKWRLKQQVNEARNAHDKGSVTPPAETDGGDPPRDPLAIPDATPPFGNDSALPSAKETEESKAEPHPIDTFRDKLALRKTIESELRSTMFDDAHDSNGSELYGLSLDLAVIPGKWSREFVEVEINVTRPQSADRRAAELRQLYYNWLAELPAQIEGDIADLERQLDRLANSQRDKADYERLVDSIVLDVDRFQSRKSRETDLRRRYFDDSYGKDKVNPGKAKSHERAATRLYLATGNPQALWMAKPVYKSERKPEVYGRWQPPEARKELWSITRKGRVDSCPSGRSVSTWKRIRPEEIRRLIKSLSPRAPKKIKKKKAKKDLVRHGLFALDQMWSDLSENAARKLLREAVVSRYQNDLSDLACVWVDHQNVIKADDPVYGSLTIHSPLRHPKAKQKYELGERYVIPNPLTDSYDRKPEFPLESSIRLLGAHEFARRLLIAEEDIQAYAAHPRELAQSISDVAARESLMSLVLAVEAMLPAKGVSAALDSQKLERLQERFHAILRQPLVVGFARGGGKLGWVLGPRFGLDNARADFRHSNVSHDVGAAIAVPAWLSSVQLRGTYQWIHARGEATKKHPLWEDSTENQVVVRLPRPTDVMERITRSLVDQEIIRPRSNVPGLQRRPDPMILEPKGGDEAIEILSGKDRSLLVMGSDVWRDPQVFIGNQKADSVEILSSMEGIVAHFSDLEYPKVKKPNPVEDPGVTRDLTVVTTFGQDIARGAVKIFYSPPKNTPVPKKTGKDAELKTNYLVAGKNLNLTFAYERPKAFHHIDLELTAPSISESSRIEAGASKWDAQGKNLKIKVPTSKWPLETKTHVAHVLLRQFIRPNQATGSVVSGPKKLKLALFEDEGARSFHPSSGTFTAPASGPNTHAVEFDNAGKLKGSTTLRFEIPAKMRPVFDVAYPGFFGALEKGEVKLRILESGAAKAPDTLLPVSKLLSDSNKIMVGVKEKALQDARKPLVAVATGQYKLALTYPVEGKATRSAVPIVESSVLTIKQAASGVSARLLLNEVVIPFHGKPGERINKVPGDAPLHVLQVEASQATLDLFHPGWNKDKGASMTISGHGFDLEYRSSVDSMHYYGMKVPGNELAIVAAGAAVPILKLGGKNLEVESVTPTKTLLLKRQTQAKLKVTPTSVKAPTGAGSATVTVTLSVSKDLAPALPTSIKGETLYLQLSNGAFRVQLTQAVKVDPVTGDLFATYIITSADQTIWPLLTPNASFQLKAGCNGTLIGLETATLTITQ